MKRFRKTYRRARGVPPPAAIIGIVAAVVLVAAIVAGNILNSCLDDETYRKWTEGVSESESDGSTTPAQRVPSVAAYPFRLGTSLRTLGNDPPSALAIPLNHADGTMCYRSSVTDYLGLEVANGAASNAANSMKALLEVVPYLIGVWQVDLPSTADDAVIYAAAASDAAVLREFLSMGGTEILLCGVPMTEKNFDVSYSYLTELISLLGTDTRLSVSVSLAVAESESGRDYLYVLGKLLPFLTLDLSNEDDVGTEPSDSAETDANGSNSASESPLLRAQFYLSGYKMRLSVSQTQTNLIRSAEQTVSDFLILPS